VELSQGLDHETSLLFALELATLLVELAQGLGHETSSHFALELDTLLVELAQGLGHETSLHFALELGLSDPAPTSAPSKKSHSGISWME
jgi:hypothetical protein